MSNKSQYKDTIIFDIMIQKVEMYKAVCDGCFRTWAKLAKTWNPKAIDK